MGGDFNLGNYGAEIERTLGRLQRAVARDAMYRAAMDAKRHVVFVIQDVKPYAPIDTGQMRRSYMVTKMRLGARLENVAPHAAAQEFGTRPFKAPYAVLLDWAKRKQRGTKVRGKKRAAAAQLLAVKARAAIAKRGIKPKGFHAKASERFGFITQSAIINALLKVKK